MEYVHCQNDKPKYLFRDGAGRISVHQIIESTLSGFIFNPEALAHFDYRITDSYYTQEVFEGFCRAWLANNPSHQ